MNTASLIDDVSVAHSDDFTASPHDMPTRTVVFSSQKGGSGKTTLCG